MKKYDIVVVGAGPAGSSAASALANMGFKVLLLEQFRFPREKSCAGVLYPRVLEEFQVEEECVETHIMGTRIFGPKGEFVEVSFYREGVVVSRKIFDWILLNKAKEAGTNVMEKVKAMAVKWSNEGVYVNTSKGIYQAEYVIAADGVFSQLAKYLGLNWREEDLAITLQYVCLLTEEVKKDINSWFEVHLVPSLAPYGWIWVAPRREEFLVGIGMPYHVSKSLESRLKQFILRRFTGHHLKIKSKEKYYLPISGPRKKSVYASIIFVGDAGGFVRQDTGEGIHYAIHSGLAAAEAIQDTVEKRSELARCFLEKLEEHGLTQLYVNTDFQKYLEDDLAASTYVKRLRVLSEFFC